MVTSSCNFRAWLSFHLLLFSDDEHHDAWDEKHALRDHCYNYSADLIMPVILTVFDSGQNVNVFDIKKKKKGRRHRVFTLRAGH